MSPEVVELPRLSILLASLPATSRCVELPVLGGSTTECLFSAAEPAGQQGSFELFRSTNWLLGAADVPVHRSIEDSTRTLYQE
jgi:hypothetical protein